MLGGSLRETFAARHEVVALTRDDLDVCSCREFRRVASEQRADWIVHAAAFTRVDEAETNPEEAFRVNALGSRNAAAAAMESGAALLYYSTDYVFTGSRRRPLREWDAPAPINQYGRSKLAGEWFVRTISPAHLIVRTSWLFGPGGPNFVEKILTRARSGETLRVVDDQRGSPTFTRDLAAASLLLLERQARGTYHVTNSEECTWCEFARAIVSLAGVEAEASPVTSDEVPAPAPRPAYSVLDNCMLKLERIPLLRGWREALADYLKELDV